MSAEDYLEAHRCSHTDDRSWNHNAANTETSQNQQTPECAEVVNAAYSKSATACSHENGGDDHELLIVTAENRQQPEYDAGTSQDREADWQTTDANTNGVMAVNVESLCGPEHEDGEEVGAADEGDDQCQSQDAWILPQSLWEHRVLGAIRFPDAKGDEQDYTEDERCQHMG